MTNASTLDKSPALLADLGVAVGRAGKLSLGASVALRDYLERDFDRRYHLGEERWRLCPLACFLNARWPREAVWDVGYSVATCGGLRVRLSDLLAAFARRVDTLPVPWDSLDSAPVLAIYDELVLEGFG